MTKLSLAKLFGLNKVYEQYKSELSDLKMALSLTQLNAYFSGHQSISIPSEATVEMKKAYVNFCKSKCKTSLETLASHDIDVEDEQHNLYELTKED